MNKLRSKMMTKEKKNRKESGFTLVELLITIFIVSVALVGMISFFNSTLESQFEAKNEIIAAGLAQEGVELVRNIRDYNVLKGEDWFGLDIFGGTDLCQRIDRRSVDDPSFGLGFWYHKCILLLKDEVCLNSGRYRQCNLLETATTDFKRSISVSETGNLATDGHLEVTCTVTWKNGSRETKAVQYLYKNE